MNLAQHLIEHAALGIDGKPLVGWNYKGDLASTAALPATGTKSEAYTIDGDVWAWNGAAWVNIGSVRGPQGQKGDTGDTGATGPQGPEGPAGPTTWAGITDKPGLVAESNGTASGLTLNDGYTEEIFAVSGTTPALSPTNGSIQTWTLSGGSTPTAGTWANGQSITLMIDDGSAHTITWTALAVTWKTGGGTAPKLQTTGFTAIALWKVGNVIYGARVGDA